EAQVTVDIPKLTVYVAPLYARANDRFDATSRGTDANVAVYHATCQSFTGTIGSPKIVLENGTAYTYAYNRTSDMATTPLPGSQSVPSDYNYEPAQRFVQKDWPAGGDALHTSATLTRSGVVCSEKPPGWGHGGWCGS
ncbi:hypothetical protein DU055_24310, partial [Salmonella enterica subsp. enterica serovar Hofit]|nr:hypothetical protein [Salmonella enterica subsp. enterica serovar Hofit]